MSSAELAEHSTRRTRLRATRLLKSLKPTRLTSTKPSQLRDARLKASGQR
jgi:hypothetical protein